MTFAYYACLCRGVVGSGMGGGGAEGGGGGGGGGAGGSPVHMEKV